MARRRIISCLYSGLLLVVVLLSATNGSAAEGESKLATEVARAERILIGIPEKKGVEAGGKIDVRPGEKFFVEIQRALRGTGRKGAPALIINGGDDQRHPQFVAGKPYVFLLKKDSEGSRWINLGDSEIPIRDGKVQYLDNGKVVEELAVGDFEELAARGNSAAAEKVPTRESLTGKWIFVFSDSRAGADFFLWLLDLTIDEARQTTVKLAASSKLMQASTIKSASIAGDHVHLVVEADGVNIDFHGRFEGGLVRGDVLVGRSTVMPARMVPTEVKNMRGYDNPVADSAREEFLDAAGQDEAFGALSRFVRRHPQSPLALAAYAELITQARTEGFDRGKFEKLAGEYLQAAKFWGARLQIRAFVDMGLALSRHEYLPELALEYLTGAQQKFDDDVPADWKQAVGIERGRRLIAAGHEPEGIAELNQIRAEFPFEPEVLYALARQAEKEKKLEEALTLYGEIATLPLMEQTLLETLKAVGRKPPREQYPSRVVTRLWSEKHGDVKGLSAWLDELYETGIRSIATEKRPPRKKNEGTRVVLCELFTNGYCQPCVSADAATSALESTYAKSEVIVLRYHQPKPGPDQFSNEETADRFKQYNCSGTPTLIVNGRRFPGGGGPLSEAPRTYRQLKASIDPLLDEKIELRLELSAKAHQGKVALSATATGLKNFPANARLMLALAEEKIACAMNNGIRSHEMVVRTFPGSLGGTAPVKGQLSFTGEVDLSKLRKRLAKQLAATERETYKEFDDKPLDLQALQLVAMLQNSETGEVLQAAAVPVTGSTSDPVDLKATDKPEGPNKPPSGGN